MVAIKLEDFGGLIPRMSPRLLPVNMARTARNTKLLNGEARGFRSPRQLADLTAATFTVKRAYRIAYTDAYGDPAEHWMTFDTRDVDIVRSPIINDQFDRYYWAGDGVPKYNTRSRIIQGLDPYWLGIPRPVAAPTVAGDTSASDLTRAYVYTFVSAYGEEGQPSNPTVETGGAGTWVVSGMDTSVPDAVERNITAKRIYRTIAGNTTNLYFFVAEVSLATASYNDSIADDVVALNNILESTSWAGPPADMEGFVVMPNGYLVGWAGRRVLFSEPYRPHAWPAEYELSTEYEIVGMAVWGSTLIIGTRSQPYLGQGATPQSLTLQKLDAVEPCLSRRGMVATVVGAYYPSINGLVLVNSSGVSVITQDILTKEEWAFYNPGTIYAAQLGLQYIAFVTSSFGFIFNPTEPKTKLVELDRFDGVNGIETDRYTGNVYLIRQDRAMDWDPEDTERLFWRWKSKEFHLPKPINFGAVKIKFATADIDVTQDVFSYYGPINDQRFAAGPLNTINGHPVDTVQYDYDMYGDLVVYSEPQLRTPIGGSALFPLNDLALQDAAVRFIVYTNGPVGMVKVFDKVVSSEAIIRLPAGFKRDVWQFELVSNAHVYSVVIAETGKELAAA